MASNTKFKFGKILLPILFLIFMISSAFALDEIIYSPFSEVGGFTINNGRDVTTSYNGVLYVGKGTNFYKYDISSWDYLGTQAVPDTILDVKRIDNILYVNNETNLVAYNLSDSFSFIDSWPSSIGTFNSFDVHPNKTHIAFANPASAINIVDYDTKSTVDVISRSSLDVVRYSYDGEMLLALDGGAWKNGVYGYTSSNYQQVWIDIVDDTYARSLSVSPTRNQYLSGWSYSSSKYGTRQRNFTSSGITSVRQWVGTYQPRVNDYSEDGNLIVLMRDADDIRTVSMYNNDNGSLIGTTFTPSGYTNYGKWAYIREDNDYVVMGSSSYLYVLNTDVAKPLVSTIDVDYNSGENSAIFSGQATTLGDSDEIQCAVKYKHNETGSFSVTSAFTYNTSDSFPKTYEVEVPGLSLSLTYEYKAVCSYETDLGTGEAEGISKFFNLNIDVLQVNTTPVVYDAENRSTLFAGYISDLGSAASGTCGIKYRPSGSFSSYSIASALIIDAEESEPIPFSLAVPNLLIGVEYEYKASCEYDTDFGNFESEGELLYFTPTKAPFDAFTKMRNNLGFIVGMLIIIGIVGFLASTGIGNPIVILALTVIGSFVMSILTLFTLTTTIFITITCIAIGILISLSSRGEQ